MLSWHALWGITITVDLWIKFGLRKGVLLWTKGPGGKGKITSILTVLFWEKGYQRRKNLKSAIQEVINSVNKLSYLPKQEDKECSLCLKFNTVVVLRCAHIDILSLTHVIFRTATWTSLRVFLWVCYRRGDGDQSIYLAYSSLFIRLKLQHNGNSRKFANWSIHLILFCLGTKHTVLNQCSKARKDPDTVAALLGMLLKF